MKVCVTQDARHFLPLIALNLDLPILHRATNATSPLHLLRQFLFLRQTDPNKVFNHRHRLATPSCLDAQNINPAAMLFYRWCWLSGSKQVCGRWRKTSAR